MADYWKLFQETGAPEWYVLHAAENRVGAGQEEDHAERKDGDHRPGAPGDGDQGDG